MDFPVTTLLIRFPHEVVVITLIHPIRTATLLIGAFVLPGCATTGQGTRYAPADGEQVIVVATAGKTGLRGSDNAAGLPHMAAPLAGASPGPAMSAVIDLAAGAVLNSIGARARLLEVRTINEKTCQPVISVANLEVDGRAVLLNQGEYAQWRNLPENNRLALLPITPDGERTQMIRRSHPCFETWVKEWDAARHCLSCKRESLFVWPGTERPIPKFEWLEE